MVAVLEVDRVLKSFGGLVAVRDVSLSVTSGEILGLIGPNGSGKTTLLNLIAGTLRPDAGAIRLNGEDVTHLADYLRVRRRINRTFQLVRIPANLTVIANVMAGLLFGSDPVPYKDAALPSSRYSGRAQPAVQVRPSSSTSSPISSKNVSSWRGYWRRSRRY